MSFKENRKKLQSSSENSGVGSVKSHVVLRLPGLKYFDMCPLDYSDFGASVLTLAFSSEPISPQLVSSHVIVMMCEF